MSEGEKKPDRPRRYVQPSMEQLKAASDQALATFAANHNSREYASVAVEKFEDWASQVSRRDNDRTEVETAYSKIERILSASRDPVMCALHARLMVTSRYCKRVAKEIVPKNDVVEALERAKRLARTRDAAVREEVKRIARAVEAVFAPKDGPPDACFSGVYEVPRESEPSPPPSPQRVEIPKDALKTPKDFSN